eukprot:7125002-Prymnesium_polylepis.1
MTISNASPVSSSVPMLAQRTWPEGKAPPLMSVAPPGITNPVCAWPAPSVHSMDIAGLLAVFRSMADTWSVKQPGSASTPVSTTISPSSRIAGHAGSIDAGSRG